MTDATQATSEEFKRGYGWKPSLPDHNNVPADVTGLEVLDEVDPRGALPPVYDQGQLGSCTGNALAGAFEYDCILSGIHFGTPSRLFIYYGERVREGTVHTDAGAYGHDGFKVLRKTGAPPEDLWPYDISTFADKPSEEAFQAAAEHKIGKYVHPGLGHDVNKLDRVEAFKRLLSNRQTIAFGFPVYESFESAELAQSGVMSMPRQGERIIGGHEVLLVGYLAEEPEYGLVRNSWGTGWGNGGYFLAPWAWLADPTYCMDWRSIYREVGA